jgi:methionine synthase I (cobalamin-dependent)
VEETFLSRLGRGGLLFDGAAGTALMEVGGLAPERVGLAGLERPGLLLDLHRDFLGAGSEVLLTGTFAACRAALAAVGAAALHPRALREAARLARRAADESEAPRWVLGDLGPIGLWARGAGPRELAAAYREEAQLLVEEGVDGLMIETLPGLFEASLALEAVGEVTQLPAVVSLSFHRGASGRLETLDGEPLPGVLAALDAAGAAALGLNCGEGSEALLEVLAECVAAVEAPLVARPSPGVPAGERRAARTPEEFAADLEAAGRLGAAGLGGCCGADATFIAALRSRLGAR